MRSIKNWKNMLAILLAVCFAAVLTACSFEEDQNQKGIVISEVVTSNGKSYEHEIFGSPDWIELHNESDHAINLLGWGITDNIKNGKKTFVLPDITLPADGYLLLLASKQEKTDTLAWDGLSPIFLGFSLKAAGEDLVLINPNLQVVDEITVPALNRDISYARRADGTFGFSAEPTPGKANTAITDEQPNPPEPEVFEPVTGIEISEVSSRNTLLLCGGCNKCDWVELYNATNTDIDLQDFTLCSEVRDYDDANLSGVIPANGYLLVFCCEKDCATSDRHVCVDLGVSRYGETVYLYDAHGFEITQLTVPEMPYKDVTYARRADGSYGYCETPTPGEANTADILNDPPVRVEETPEPEDNKQEEEEIVDPTLNAKRPAMIRISEVLPKNEYSLLDREGEHCDWVELYNTSDSVLSLDGWGLSDNPKNLTKWTFPEGTTIPAKGYLLVFLSGKTSEGSELHAGFSLSAGETLYLYNTSDKTLDWVVIPELKGNVSIGLDQNNEQVYYRYPTPMAPNGHGDKNAEALGFFQSDGVYISEVCAIHDRGSGEKDWIELYNGSGSAVSLDGWYLSDSIKELNKYRISSLSIGSGKYAVIETTASYADRKKDDGNFGINPSGETLYLSDESGCIRDSFQTGMQRNGMSSGRIEGDNHTDRVFFTKKTKGAKNSDSLYRGYASTPMFSETGLYHTQAFTVTISVLDPKATVYYTTDGSEPDKTSKLYTGPIGISQNAVIRAVAYTDGLLRSDIVTYHYLFEKPHTVPVVCIAMSPTDFNTVYKVKEHKNIKERKGYVNFYEADGLMGTAFPCDIKAKGRGTLTYISQKSLTLSLRAEYGMRTVEYPFFPGYEFTEFGSFALRQAGQDYATARLRDAFVSRACLGLNVDCANSRFCVVYVNGSYYGIYDFNEDLNSRYLETHFGVDADTVNSIMRNGNTAMKGSNSEFKNVFNDAKKANLSSDSAYQKFLEKVDADAFIDYVICRQLFLDTDSFNQKYWRTTDYRVKWRPILYDLDYAMFSSSANRNIAHLYFNKEGTASKNGSRSYFYFTVALRTNAGWRQKFIERYAELVMTQLSGESLTKLLDQMTKELEPEMERHIARWKYPKSISSWKSNIKTFRSNLEKRPMIALEHIRKEFKISESEMNALIAKYSKQNP